MKKSFVIFLVPSLVLALVLGIAAASFVDVPADAYYAEAAQRMADQGILTGYGDGYYYGEQNVTRAQMAVVACRLLDKEDEAKSLAGDTVFSDIKDVHAWATGYVNYAVANGIIIGDGDGNFRPDDNVKYEEAIKILVCALGLDEGVEIDPTDWSKEYIEAAEKVGLTKNLIGKKGEAMKRSDVAVICDAAMTVLKTEAESIEADSKETPETTVVPEAPTKPVVSDTTEVTKETQATEKTKVTRPNMTPEEEI